MSSKYTSPTRGSSTETSEHFLSNLSRGDQSTNTVTTSTAMAYTSRAPAPLSEVDLFHTTDSGAAIDKDAHLQAVDLTSAPKPRQNPYTWSAPSPYGPQQSPPILNQPTDAQPWRSCAPQGLPQTTFIHPGAKATDAWNAAPADLNILHPRGNTEPQLRGLHVCDSGTVRPRHVHSERYAEARIPRKTEAQKKAALRAVEAMLLGER